MDSNQIEHILFNTKKICLYFLGCFSSDCIPSHQTTFPHAFILNTDPSDAPGEHWIAIWVESPKMIEYYDSLGVWPPQVSSIRTYLSRFTLIERVIRPLQSDKSSACGRHAIYFLIRKAKYREPFCKIIRAMLKAKTPPDRLVNAYVTSIIN